MMTEIPYTAILQGPEPGYTVQYVNLPPGLDRARATLEDRLDSETELVAIIQGNMPIGLGGMTTVTTPHREVPSWPF